MRIILSTILAVLICTFVKSQTIGPRPFTIKPYDLTPPPPTAGELGKYIEIPVSKYTGIPSINIPLYQINTHNYTMGINLSYHASGIKVQQRAGWVGLGWSLNAGGVITRTVKDQPDDKDTIDVVIPPLRTILFPIGKLRRSDQTDYNSLPQSFFAHADLQSDVFYFNFNGYSGSFIFDENKIPRTTDGSPLKIEYSSITYSPYNIMLLAGFTITTPDGIRYLFNDREITNSVPMQPSTCDYPSYSYLNKTIPNPGWRNYNSHISSWYLSRIIFPDTNDSIELSYTPIKYSYLERVKVSKEFMSSILDAYTTEWANRLIYLYSHTLVDGLMISQIRWSGGSVSFTPSTFDRQDILTNTTITNDGYQGKEKSLGRITINDYKNKPIKKFDFSYSYFEADSVNQQHVLWDLFQDDIDANNLYYRLKLASVTESTDSLVNPPYVFSYYEDGAKPHRHSPECDFWGYYNGNGAPDMIPTTYLYDSLTSEQLTNSLFQSEYLPIPMDALGSNPIILPGVNRNAATSDLANIYSLKKITYPTGGYHAFTFEPNQFRIYDAGFSNGFVEMNGGGIRIRKIERYDPLSSKTDSTVYRYTDPQGICSGRILNFPLFTIQRFYAPNERPDPDGTTKFATSPCDLGTTQGSHVAYSYVKEDNGANGSEEYHFDLPATFGVRQDCFDAVKNDYLYKRSDCKNLYTLPPNGATYIEIFNSEMNKSFITFPDNPYFDWNRGQLLDKKTYNVSHQLLKWEKNEYCIGDYRYIFGMAKGQIITACPFCNSGSPSIYFESSQFASLYHDICGWKYLKRQEIETFDPERSDSSSFKEVITYTYNDNVNRQLSKTQQLQSNQTLSTTEIYYPTDFVSPAQPPNIQIMLNKNIINKPIELVNYVEENGIKKYAKALLNVYDTQCRLIENQTLDLINPSVNFNYSKNLSSASQLNFDSRYSRKQSYIYNSAGKPVTSIVEGNSPVSYLWGYNNTCVVAEIIGAGNAAVNAVNADITKLENGDVTEQARIRTALPYAMISFYTYRPLVGLISKTDPRGIITTYTYDKLNRLQSIKDTNGRFIQTVDYNYKH